MTTTTTTTVTKPLTWHRYPDVYHARGAQHEYKVDRPHSPGNYSGVWQLRLLRLHTVPGETVPVGELIYYTTVDTLTLAKRIATEFEQLGEGYRSSDHGHRERSTEATLRAYETELAAMGWS